MNFWVVNLIFLSLLAVNKLIESSCLTYFTPNNAILLNTAKIIFTFPIV